MPAPRFSSRRWFWGLTLAAFLWGWVGRSSGNPQNHPFLYRVQSIISNYIITPTLIPATALFQFVQNGWTSAVRVVETHTGKDSVADLQIRVAELEAQVHDRDLLLDNYRDHFNNLRTLAPQSLTSDDFLSANIRGHEGGPGADLITLDRGYSAGVRIGMAVVAQSSIIGRVDQVGAVSCSVRLITDPQVKVQAVIVRRENDGPPIFLNNEPCLIEGLGSGQLQCNTLKVNDSSDPPREGDLVEIADVNWPSEIHNMILGEVRQVGRKDTQMLRYDLLVAPRVNINAIRNALIILKN